MVFRVLSYVRQQGGTGKQASAAIGSSADLPASGLQYDPTHTYCLRSSYGARPA